MSLSPAHSLVALVAAVVERSRRHAAILAPAILLATVGLGFYAVRHVGLDSDTDKLMSPDLPWRKANAELDREFPQNDDVLAVVVDGATPDLAEDAAARLTAELRARPDLFRDVRQPDGGRFFRENGALFLSQAEVRQMADNLIAAQPMLGTLAADPSARGVFDALDLFAQGAVQGEIAPALLARPFDAVARATDAARAGRYQPLSWQNLLSQRKPLPRELRRFVLARPVLDYRAVEPAQRAVDAIHDAARAAGFVPARGVRVRVTGSPALSDDQLAALKEGAGLTAVCSLCLLIFWLVLAVRSAGATCAILITMAAGLVACVAFAVRTIGPFDPISIAFAPLFVGITVDFGIQFSVRYVAELHWVGAEPDAFGRAARGVGVPLVVAGIATAAGFFALVPTAYLGVSHLGLVAGVGMIVALILNLTLLPALLALFRPAGFPDAGGFSWGLAADQFLMSRRGWVLAVGGILAAGSIVALRGLRFDFNPVDLVNPRAESVQALFDLMKSPDTTPYTLDVLEPSAAAAADLAKRAGARPEVSRTLWVGSFVPPDQAPKLATLQDARDLLEPTLSPVAVKPPPTPAEVLRAAGRCAADVGRVSDPAAANLAGALRRVVSAGPPVVPALDANLTAGVAPRLEDLRLVLQAAPVALDTIPAEVRKDWIGADGRYRVQIFPAGDARDAGVLRRFVAAVRRVAPESAGMPIDILESGRLVVRAFIGAGIIAIVAIVVLLGAVLRRVRDVASVLGPLILAGLLTLGTGALIGLPLNFANIVTLPLLFAIGVAFDIYFVLRWRIGEAGLLRSPTARGVVFSALATGMAFGSLAFSMSPGMADMGKLLSLGLFYTLVCTLFYLPALLGPAPHATAAPSR